MEIKIKPQKIIPANYSVRFDEGGEYDGYIVQPQPYEDRLRPDIEEWLNANALGWSVNFDRGDWGDGPAFVKIDFETEAQARAFAAEFTNIPCPNARSRGHCPHMGAALSLIDQEKDRIYEIGPEVEVKVSVQVKNKKPVCGERE
jgi:hypothetical protein